MFNALKSNSHFRVFLSIAVIAVMASVFAFTAVKAWTEPTQAPPAGNTGAPINVGTVSQTKTGDLTIGTSAASGDVTFKVYAGGTGNSAAIQLQGGTSSAAAQIYQASANALNFWVNGAQRMLINSSGNVGIGTTNPGAKLDIRTASSNGLYVDITDTAGATGYAAYFKRSTTNDANQPAVYIDYDNTAPGGAAFKIDVVRADTAEIQGINKLMLTTLNNGNITFTPNGTGNTLITSGNVGIGTATPTVKLDVVGNTKITGNSTITGTATIGSLSGLLKGTVGVVSAITDSSSNWNTAYGWGDHSIFGYLTSLDGAVLIDQSTPQEVGTRTDRLLKLWATDIDVTNAITGSISGNAETVTTNANLTGPITSTGNATAIASQTGTGTTFVMNTAPTIATSITTPLIIGSAASGGTLTLQSTAHATKGKILFGTTSAYDEVNNRLGIGITSPARKLVLQINTNAGELPSSFAYYNIDVRDPSYAVQSFRMDTTGIGAATFQEVATIQAKYEIHDHATRNASLAFFTANASGATERMRILGNGNVGIGTATPNNTIQVKDLVNFDNAKYGTFLGYQAGNVNTGNHNSFVGYQAGRVNTTGDRNSAIGVYALYSNTTGRYLSAIGMNTLYSNTDGSHNSAIGNNALYSNTTGISNSAVGANALYSNIGGSYNSAMGVDALYFNTTGAFNSATGIDALHYNVTGSYNTAVGLNAGMGVLDNSFSNNSLFGYRAGFALSTGSNNILLGYQAGDALTTGANNIVIGYDIDAPSATGNNQLNIGNTIYGDLSTGRIGIGTITPAYKLDVWDTGTASAMARINNSNATRVYTGLRLDRQASEKWFVGMDTTNDNLIFRRVGTTNDITIATSGAVGIGTATPTSKLQVVGLPTYANNAAAIAGGLTVGAFYQNGADPSVVCVVY